MLYINRLVRTGRMGRRRPAIGERNNRMPEENSTSVTVYVTSWCGDCRRTLAYLDAQHIAHAVVDIERDPAAMALVKQVNHGNRSVPTIVFPDGSTLVEPTTAQLARKLGLPA